MPSGIPHLPPVEPVAERHDDLVTYRVRSRSRPMEVHVAHLNDYHGNGSCDCERFTRVLEPLLRRMVTPEEAINRGLVRLTYIGQRDCDVLRCWHIFEARFQFLDDVLAQILRDAQAKQTAHA